MEEVDVPLEAVVNAHYVQDENTPMFLPSTIQVARLPEHSVC